MISVFEISWVESISFMGVRCGYIPVVKLV